VADNLINRVLSGRYKITERIGVGGMAEVYLAQDTVLGRIVAIKVMLPQYAADSDFTVRFRQEAASAANLQSPYIVNIYDWGQDQGTYYIVMEYVHGSDLKSGIKERGAINQRKVAEIGIQVCQALSVAHNMDITHRDIKPQNIMVQPDGNVKVMDFGIACAKNSTLTQTSSVLGTAHYISPEQAQGREIGPASDIYSLGIVMYEAATGKLPFDGTDAITVALKQVNEQPVAPRRINPNIDPALEAIILKTLNKDPRERYITAAELRSDLVNYLSGKPVSALGISGEETVALPTAGIAAGAAVAGAAGMALGADGRTAVMPGGAINAQHANGQRGSYGQVPYNPNNTGSMRTVNGRPYGGPEVGGGRYGVSDPSGRMNMRNGSHQFDNGPQEKSKKPLIIGIIVAVVAIAIIAGFLIFGGDQKNTVPSVINKTYTQAVNIIQKAGYTVGTVTEEYNDTVAANYIIRCNPDERTKLDPGGKIDLVVSKGPELATIPNLLGMTNEEALAAITAAGFVASAGEPQYSSDYAADRVMSQSPAPKSQAAKGTTITYALSKGSESVDVPRVIGKHQNDAVNMLTERGLSHTVIPQKNGDYDSGYVFEQNPSGGKLNKGDVVTLYVSKGGLDDPSKYIGKTLGTVISQLSSEGWQTIDNVNGASSDKIVTSLSASGTTVKVWAG